MPNQVYNKHDFLSLKIDKVPCPLCQRKCDCKKCKRATIDDDFDKIKN